MTTEEQRKPLVLIVDDDDAINGGLQMILESANYDTMIARNGEEAKEILQQQKPDAMTLDINMPELSGLELLDFFQGTDGLEGIKIILMSGQPEDELIEGVVAGADWVLQKPLDLSEVIKVLEDLLSK